MPQRNPKTRKPGHEAPASLDSIPRTGYLRQEQILGTLIPVSSTTLWRWVRAGKFPKPLKLSPRVTAWRASDIQQWLEAR
ncbi:MAG: AlpA family phage regulatory protein [Methylotetracoccus sp.]